MLQFGFGIRAHLVRGTRAILDENGITASQSVDVQPRSTGGRGNTVSADLARRQFAICRGAADVMRMSHTPESGRGQDSTLLDTRQIVQYNLSRHL